ncbi:hypothetical protein PNEG_02165 [Pneumocystis murina B123]|uniref:P-loop containing nucleoside triphosphate hydrolase protein n=1 Tax=Pneumocystis murina (strain B123) TaxID=1069680 RepID=M7PGJ1_PNEMU|nr:hypothetical protein PNEG_02165 [Pneumocystis murina B123]EMR09579.1 hypothetical protein PNEG_02165 [Pneumocystis murina B123]
MENLNNKENKENINSKCIELEKTKKNSCIQSIKTKLKDIILGPAPSSTKVIPEAHANIISKLLWSWLDHLMVLGFKRPLEISDLWFIDEKRTSKKLGDELLKHYEKHKQKKQGLLLALNDTFRNHYWSATIIKFFCDLLVILSSLMVKYIIIFSQKRALHDQNTHINPKQHVVYGIMLCLVLYLFQTISSFCLHHSFYRTMTVGALSRTALVSCIYRKSLLLKNKQRLFYNNGKIMNLINTDVTNVDISLGYTHIIWTATVQILLIFLILYINLGVPALLGLSLLLISAPILAKVSKTFINKNLRISSIADIRARITNETLQSIKIIKFYAWENFFLDKILNLRKNEEKVIKLLIAIRSLVDSLFMTLPFFCIILAFITYYLIKKNLDPAIIFSSLTLLNHLRISFMLLPFAMGVTSNMLASLKRIQTMLSNEDDFENSDSVKEFRNTLAYQKPENSQEEECNDAIIIKNGYFTWASGSLGQDLEKKELKYSENTFFKKKSSLNQSNLEKKDKKKTKNEKLNEKEKKYISDIVLQEKDKIQNNSEKSFEKNNIEIDLKNINLRIKKGELVCIVGPIGSGKSTLLLSIINEVYIINGTIKLNGTISYCSQISWIQNTTIIDNILFGKPYDEQRYQEVIEACCLELDFQILPNGDLTEIGEKGVTISGGQKQRINIARAVYFGADIVLLDDPLSSVDSHVSKDIFEKCILGLLKDKTVILVTHKLDILDKADKIIYLEDGEIREIGKYSDMISKQEHFYEFVKKFLNTQVESDEYSKKAPETVISGEKERKIKTLMQDEEREIGSIKFKVYIEYIKAAAGLWIIPAVILLLSIYQFFNIGNNLWLSFWIKNQFKRSAKFYMLIYVLLGIIEIILYFIIEISLFNIGRRASTKMHYKAIHRVLRLPMSFFDTTPLGRIINRFTKDIRILDIALSDSYLMFLVTLSFIISIFILIIILLHYFFIALICLMSLFFILMSFYRASSREIKRLDSLQKSNLYSQISETLTGLPIIRAYEKQSKFKLENEKRLDLSNSAYLLVFAAQRWLALRLDAIGNMITLSITILSIISNIDPTTAGLILSYSLQIVGIMSWMLRQFSEFEINMNSVERLHHYGENLKTEAPLIIPEKRPPPDWPQNGEIIFNNVWLKYREELPYSLKNLNIHISKGEKVGIVGRTGAGKSSIIVALYRLVEISKGSITIDGISISDIGLHDLRSKLSIIPQEPTLFEGTIRSNLDPFQQYSDQEIWDSLKKSWFLDSIKKYRNTGSEELSEFNLEWPIETDGQNFSHGQRQLLTMARALLRKSKIVVFDEATSSIDAKTDMEIQHTILTHFKDATLLCIANRINTVIHYDTIIVISSGTLIEFGSPRELFNKKDGVFRSMCIHAGITDI